MKTRTIVLTMAVAILFVGYFEEVPGTEGQHCYQSMEALIGCFAE